MSNQGDESADLPYTPEKSHEIPRRYLSLESDLNGSPESLGLDNSLDVTKRDASGAAVEQHHTVPSTITSPRNGSDSWIARVLQLSPIQRLSTAIAGEKRTDDLHESRAPRAWRATYLRFGPLSGIFCMLLASACLIASLGILAGSDGQLVEHWTAPPSTYLAIFTAIANLSLRYAAFHGVILAWWYRASKGSTLSQLHWDWNSGTTLRGALSALTTQRSLNSLGLACFVSTLVVIDGPLLQRASTVRSVDGIYGKVHLNVSMTPKIPTGFTGIYQIQDDYLVSYTFNKTIMTSNPNKNASNFVLGYDAKDAAAGVVRDWYHETPLRVIKGCPGVCKAKLKAPAMIPTSCRTISMPWYFGPLSENIQVNPNDAPPFNTVALAISTVLVLTDRETLSLATAHGQSAKRHPGPANADNCVGDTEMTICTLESGTAEYDVTVQDGLATLDAPGTPKFVALANNTAVNRTVAPQYCDECFHSTLGGIAWEMAGRFEANQAYFSVGKSLRPLNTGSVVYEEYVESRIMDCPKFRDPRPDVMASLNKLMVYWGASVSSEQTASGLGKGDITSATTITGEQAGLHAVFHTDYAYFVAAAVVEIICIVLVAPTYWKYWTIGRPVSFSPLEIAKAFESRILDGCSSNSTGRDIARVVGKIEVKYGAIAADESGKSPKIAFGYPSEVESPKKGSRFEV